jgi:hypothetical protein
LRLTFHFRFDGLTRLGVRSDGWDGSVMRS